MEMKLFFNRHTENLVEIAMAFESIWERNCVVRNCDIDSLEWKQHFVNWANEFERMHRKEDWRNGDYLWTIWEFTREKVSDIVGKKVFLDV